MAYGTINADVIGTSVAGSNLGAGDASLLKNRLINGSMVIDQRNAGASVNGNSVYTVDRWYAASSQNNKYTAQRNAGSLTGTNLPVGFSNYLGITSSAATSLGATDYFTLEQYIEGFNCSDLAWGTVNAKTVTLSAQVYSSLTGTFGGVLYAGTGSLSYPFTYTISSANTWTSISITIAGPTTGTWTIDNSKCIAVCFGLGVGSTYSGTAGSWQASVLRSTTGATSVVGTSGATFYITGVQLEVGSSATGFEYEIYTSLLAKCYRYYEIIPATYLQAAQAGGGSNIVTGFYKATKRTTPTVSLTQVTGSGGGIFNNTTDNWAASAAVDGNGRIGWSGTSSAEL
jgi:hypothetical protein